MKGRLVLMIIIVLMSTGSAGKKLVLNLVKEKKNFCLSLHYDTDQNFLDMNKAEIFKFKSNDNISWYNFYFGSVSKDVTNDEQREISLNSTVYDFSVDHSSIKK